MGDIASKINSGGTPSSDISRYWGGDCPWISGADFDNNNIKDIRRTVTSEGIKESSTFVASKGDLLFVTRTGVGKIAIAPFDVAVSQDITAISFRPDIDERFVYFYFQSFKKSLLKSNQGTSINGIVRKDLVKITITVPDLEEQQKIADFLSAIDSKIEAVEGQID
ncbi:MAG: restriction endonuclease subunit S [Desulfuromonadaceae bacterium]